VSDGTDKPDSNSRTIFTTTCNYTDFREKIASTLMTGAGVAERGSWVKGGGRAAQRVGGGVEAAAGQGHAARGRYAADHRALVAAAGGNAAADAAGASTAARGTVADGEGKGTAQPRDGHLHQD
jgi:hypothetical protein